MPPSWSLPSIACALLLAAGASLAAEDLVVEAERRGEGIEVRARAFIAAPTSIVWQVVTDYERLPSFVPGIARSRVRERNGSRLRLEQSGEARFLVFAFPIEVQLEVVEAPPHWVVSHAVGGNLRRMIGRYDLLPDEARRGVKLAYVGVIEPDFDLPPLVGAAALRQMAEQQFRAMVGEIERLAPPR
ncbi:MAG TPA: SRPBCC family protein [Burkholderiales bacterium]|nr:SRPBCC family protein [Burkholderiales bacterium]